MGLWGLPGLALAFGLNFLFVSYFNWDAYISYMMVLAIITTLNFFIVDKILYRKKKRGKSTIELPVTFSLLVFQGSVSGGSIRC